MFQKIKNNQTLKIVFDTRNLGLYVLAIVALSVTWSSIKSIQKNYELEKRITKLQQEVLILEQQAKNQKLKNEYYRTDAYLDIAVRKYFNKASSGEQLIIVPSEVAKKYTFAEPQVTKTDESKSDKPQFIQNWQDWINFFLHRDSQAQ